MTDESIVNLIDSAVTARLHMIEAQQHNAMRLFNGFAEGCPWLVIELYGRTIVLHNYADPPDESTRQLQAVQEWLRARLPWIRAIVVKTRKGISAQDRRGRLVYGTAADQAICEQRVWYAVDLLMNRDASFYLDTRNVRAWALQSLSGKTVLNTFAYTGSLGVAAQAAGATRVVHLDRSRSFLNVAKRSYSLNGFPINKADFQVGDFWSLISRFKRSGDQFDCVFLDPPFFTATRKAILDLASDSKRLINKVRPLVSHDGYLVAINNALFLSGEAYMAALEEVCADGYVQVEELIPVPHDCTGYPDTRVAKPIVDPAPFNHATKIAVLKVRHKRPAAHHSSG